MLALAAWRIVLKGARCILAIGAYREGEAGVF
jgi:hypothetical protein